MIDYSTANPGPMGWGEETDTDQSRIANEKRAFQTLAAAHDEVLVPKEAKPVNEEKMKAFKDEMAKDGIDDGVCLLHLDYVVFGIILKWLAQIIGSCVASGGMRGFLYRSLAEVFILNQLEELFGNSLIGTNNIASFAPYNYRAGRKRAGINRGDGSYCSVHIQGALEDGILMCSTPGLKSDAFPEPQSSSLYRQYGNSNNILETYREYALQNKLLESVKIDDFDLAKAQMFAFKPFMVCSNWAFEPDYAHSSWKLRDGSPVYVYRRNRRTSWAHNMTIVGIVLVGTEWFVIVLNSWGDKAHRNGQWFAIPAQLYVDWIRSSEQMSIGEIDLPDIKALAA